jgi:hypothetical protein
VKISFVTYTGIVWYPLPVVVNQNCGVCFGFIFYSRFANFKWRAPLPVGVFTEILFADFVSDPVANVSIGLVDRTGGEHLWYMGRSAGAKQWCSADLSHQELLAQTDSLLPDGKLTIFVRAS